jgi:hypothetical protein
VRIDLTFDKATKRMEVTSADQLTVDWFNENPSAALAVGDTLSKRVGHPVRFMPDGTADLRDLCAEVTAELRRRFQDERFEVLGHTISDTRWGMR